MKKTIFTFIGLLIMFVVVGQITISSNDMPAKNDTIRYNNVNITELPATYENTGANYSWNFSTLSSQSQGLYEYKSATSINVTYGLFFGFDSYGLLVSESLGLGTYQLEDIYDFYKNTSSFFQAEGMGFTFPSVPIPIPGFYTDKDEIYSFPLQYNDKDSSTFKFNATIPSIGQYLKEGSRINEVDGWGTIETPLGTFNCLRVKSTIFRIDSIKLDLLPINIGLPTTEVEYKWLANGINIPVFEIRGTELLGNYTPTSIRYANVTQTAVKDDNNHVNTTVIVYPNPCGGKFSIQLSNNDMSISSLEIINVQGQTIFEKKCNSIPQKTYQVDISNELKGLYIIRAYTDTNVFVKLITIE